ncbi:MAG: L-threonylcarbamoyladenylate synthase [Acidobacteria bacterium]|nr:L-threonylcarbamoyladenylate synthase [Acidobacteriota bacterium]
MLSLRYCAGEPETPLIERAVEVLRRGGVVAYPTDTLYGLAVDPGNPRSVAQLYRIKGRQVDRAIPLIAASREQIEACGGALPPLARTLADRFWPGPLTLVVPAWPALCEDVHGGSGTVAVRVPAHSLARALAAGFGAPITSTSANRSGQPPATTADEVRLALAVHLDVLLDAGATPGGPPSTIVSVTGAEPRLVRAGAVPWERVLECLA